MASVYRCINSGLAFLRLTQCHTLLDTVGKGANCEGGIIWTFWPFPMRTFNEA